MTAPVEQETKVAADKAQEEAEDNLEMELQETKAALVKAQKDLTRANAEAAKERHARNDAIEAGKKPSESEQTLQQAIKASATRAALLQAGFVGSEDADAAKRELSKLTRMIDGDALKLDPKTGEVSGLDEQVADVKDTFPALFGKKSASKSDDGGSEEKKPVVKRGTGKEAGQKPPSTAERIAAQLMGK